MYTSMHCPNWSAKDLEKESTIVERTCQKNPKQQQNHKKQTNKQTNKKTNKQTNKKKNPNKQKTKQIFTNNQPNNLWNH